MRAEEGDTPECGTVCCIAGAATQFFNDENGEIAGEAFEKSAESWTGTGEADWLVVASEARYLLGLERLQAKELFEPNVRWTSITPEIAAKVIRHLMETGEVNWMKCLPKDY